MLCFRRNLPLDGAVITTPFEAKDTISKRYSGSVSALLLLVAPFREFSSILYRTLMTINLTII